ncbi:MAG: hypothetical protein J6Z22_09770, partial [Lachnospiraceae bacterium]|nr:hypothetical protein [Lachnospiraceae bacterium]
QGGGQQGGGQQGGGQQGGGQQVGAHQGGGQQGGGQQGSGQQAGGGDSGAGHWNSGSDLAKDAHEGIQKLWDFVHNPKQFTKDDWKEKGKSIEMHNVSIGFSVNFAFMWEYNPIDDCFYFKSGAISAAASLEIRVEARLTPCPVFYLDVVFGASIEIGTGFSLLRVEKEGMNIPVKNMGNIYITEARPATLKTGDKITFSLRVTDNTRGFKLGGLQGNIHILIKDEEGNALKSGKFESPKEKQDYTVPLSPDYAEKGVLNIEVTALSDTQIEKLCSVFAESKYIWNGINIAPQLSIEAGAGVGMELLKVELFIRVNFGMAFTLGTYNYTNDDYDPASFDSLDFSAVVGFNITVLFFDYSMDIVGYYLHGERKQDTADDMVWSDHWGLANGYADNIGAGNIDDEGDHEGDKAYMSGASFGLSKPKDISGTQHIVKSNGEASNDVTEIFANGKVNRSIAANDINVPFQLSNYGTSGDAFKLAGGMTTGYDYKAFSVNGESYILYPISVGAQNAEDPVDYTQLVMSKVVVTSSSTGLVNPLDPSSDQAYIVVDEPDADGKNTGDLDYAVSVDGTKITVAYATYENHSDGSADSVSVSKTVVIRRAVIDLADENPEFTVTTLTEAGNYQFLPQQEGDITIYAGVTDRNTDAADAMLEQFSAYLQAKYNVTEADITAAKPKPGHLAPASRYQVESIQRSIYGAQNSLFAVSADGNAVEMKLPKYQTLSNIESGMADGKVLVAYTTDQVVYMDSYGMTTSTMTENTNRGTIKRLYLCSFNDGAWSNPMLLYTVVDYDDYNSTNKNTYPKDGVYVDTVLAEEKVDPYFAKLQFLRANLSGSMEELMLFEMNGNTYVIREEQLKSAMNAGSMTVTPIFTEEVGTECTIASDYDGNLAVVYVAPVVGTVNNATFIAWWDKTLGQWGNANMLAMNHMQVYEDGIKYNLTGSDLEAAYYGNETSNQEYEAYLANLNVSDSGAYAFAKGDKDRFTFSNVQMLLDGVGNDAKLVVFTAGNYMKLVPKELDVNGNKVTELVNKIIKMDTPITNIGDLRRFLRSLPMITYLPSGDRP